MNQRERMIALIVGSALIVGLGLFAYMRISNSFEARQKQIKTLLKERSDRQKQIAVARKAQQRMKVYEEMALPANREFAASVYQSQLLSRIEDAGMVNVKITPSSGGSDRVAAFKQLTYTINCQGNLEQLVTLLHRFYSRNVLHRLRQLRVQPVANTKNLNLFVIVDGLSLATASNETQLTTTKSLRLEHGSLENYLKVISERNLFAPANHAPKIASIGTQRGTLDKSLSFTLKASDPDASDEVQFRLAEDVDLPGATIDPKSGAFQWTPKEKGDFEVTFIAYDNGVPARSDKQVVKISVSDPPPPPPDPPKPPPRLEFDHAKYTKLTAVIEERASERAGGKQRLQAWLLIQPSGETLRVYRGDSFTVGSLTATVSSIDARSISLDRDGKRRVVSLGQALTDATEKALPPPVVPADQAASGDPVAPADPDKPASEKTDASPAAAKDETAAKDGPEKSKPDESKAGDGKAQVEKPQEAKQGEKQPGDGKSPDSKPGNKPDGEKPDGEKPQCSA